KRKGHVFSGMAGCTHTCIPIRKILTEVCRGPAHISGLPCRSCLVSSDRKESGGKLHGSYSWCRLTKRQTCRNRINLYLRNRKSKRKPHSERSGRKSGYPCKRSDG